MEFELWNLGGLRVQLHASLLVAGVLMVYVTTQANSGELDVSLYGLLAWVILLASVILHEVGHGLAAWRLGGSFDSILLGPLGGMLSPHVPREPQREVAVALAGPLANLLVMLVLGPPLLLSGSGVKLGEILLDPLYPSAMLDGSPAIIGLKMAFWLNWLLVLANLLPAAPMDGGLALRSILWPVMGYRGCALHAQPQWNADRAVVMPDCDPGRRIWPCAPFPLWLPLVLMAIFLYFSVRREAHRVDDEVGDDDLFGYDFSQGYTSLERPAATTHRNHPGPLRRWLEQRRQIRQRRLRELEAEEERRVDEVLIRIKQFGKESLSSDEQLLLQRVSARYRNRLQS